MRAKGRTEETTLFNDVLIAATIIAFFIVVILVYYSMLYEETRNRIITSGEMSAQQVETQINSYLSTSIDTVKLAAYTLDNMLAEGASPAEIQSYMVAQTSAVMTAVLEDSAGLYGWIDGRFVSGTN